MNISPLISTSGQQDVGDDFDALRQLDVDRIKDGHLLMPVPCHKEAMVWAQACLAHDIGAVVSLGTPAEHDRLYPCMENDGPIVADGRQVEFSEPDVDKGAGPASKRLMRAHPGTFAGIVRIKMGTSGGERPDAKHEVSSFTIPIAPERPICPAVLLATCQALHEEVSGRPIAFQSPHGDHRAAVFAAAHGLFQGFVKGEVDGRNLEASVKRQCDDLGAARSATGVHQAGHQASLLAMGRMMLEDPRDDLMGTPTALRTPEVLSAPLPMTPRSAMKGARAQERELQAGKKTRAREKPGKRPAVRFEQKSFGFLRMADRKEAREIEAQKKGWKEEELVQVRQSPGRRSTPQNQTGGRVVRPDELDEFDAPTRGQ